MTTCQTCRYWSQMIAQSNRAGLIEALCLSKDSPTSRRFTASTWQCAAWRENTHGAVDEPPDYGETARAIYAKEEAAPMTQAGPGEPDYVAEPSYKLTDALKLVLLFHSDSPWDAEKKLEWLRIAGSKEATTKVLCDHVRSALAVYGEQ